MTRGVRQSRDALRDLDDIWDYIAADNVNAADRFVDLITEKFHSLARNPSIGQPRPDLQPDLRCFPVRKYVIYYREISDGIEVVRVLHGRETQLRFFAVPNRFWATALFSSQPRYRRRCSTRRIAGRSRRSAAAGIPA